MPVDQQQKRDRLALRVIQENSQFLNTTLDLDFVLNNLLLSALSKLFVTKGAVWLKEGEEDGICIFAPAARKGFRDPAVSVVKLEKAMQSSCTVLAEDIPTPFATMGVNVLAPIISDSNLIGFLGLGAKATGAGYQPEELEFLESLVNISSATIRNSMVVDDLQRTNVELDKKIQQLNTLFDLSQEFNATLDRDRLIKLLSFALMGQMAVNKYAFLFRNESAEVSDVRVVMCSGFEKQNIEANRNAIYDAAQSVWRRSESAETHEGLDDVELVVPLRQLGERVGVLLLGSKLTGAEYQIADIEFVTSLGNLAVSSIKNSFLVEEQIEKEKLEEEMRLARQIQVGLQPETAPEFDGLDLAMLAIPSRHVAGDYVDIVHLDDSRLLLAIGDITGKGLPASLLMSNLQASLHILLPMPLTLEEGTQHINRVICENTDYSRFATYFHCIYERETQKLDYVNAGHNPPYLIRSDGSLETLEKGGLLLGVMPNAEYERGSVFLQPGDVLCLFTDGITEAMSPELEEYEEHRLIEVLKKSAGMDATQIMEAIRADLASHTCTREAESDDMTIIVMKVT